MMALCLNGGMDTADIRRAALKALIAERFGGVARRLAHAAGKPDGQINDMLAGRKAFGDRIARELEKTLDLPRWFLDQEGAGADEETINPAPAQDGLLKAPPVAAELFAEISDELRTLSPAQERLLCSELRTILYKWQAERQGKPRAKA